MARYGHQPLSEIRRTSVSELESFAAEISKIVKYENKPRKEDDRG